MPVGRCRRIRAKGGRVGDHIVGDAVDMRVGDFLLRVNQCAPALAFAEVTVNEHHAELDDAISLSAKTCCLRIHDREDRPARRHNLVQ